MDDDQSGPRVLHSETRWTRTYQDVQRPNTYYLDSRIGDGSATITLDELSVGWPTWTYSEQQDFCNALYPLLMPEANDILRFLMKNAAPELAGLFAFLLLDHLPREEAEPFIIEAATKAPLGKGGCFYALMAQIPFPGREQLFASRLEALLARTDFDDEGVNGANPIACETRAVVASLIKGGARACDYVDIYNRLKTHPGAIVRLQTKNFLSKYFEA